LVLKNHHETFEDNEDKIGGSPFSGSSATIRAPASIPSVSAVAEALSSAYHPRDACSKDEPGTFIIGSSLSTSTSPSPPPPPPSVSLSSYANSLLVGEPSTGSPDVLLPPGLFLYEEFVTEEEEQRILEQLDAGRRRRDAPDSDNDRERYEDVVAFQELDEADNDVVPWKATTFNGTHLGMRWGVHCQLKERRVMPADRDLPEVLKTIVMPRLLKLKPMNGCHPNEANAIDYRRHFGHWLKSHVDDRRLSKEPIANLSLAGDCVMTYTRVVDKPRKTNQQLQYPAQQYRVLLRCRTLQILTGPARYEYAHGIDRTAFLSPRRVSITMRESPVTVHSVAAPSAPSLSRLPNPRSPTPVPWWKCSTTVSTTKALQSVPFLTPTSVPISGLFVFEDFITEEEEQMILAELDDDQSNPFDAASGVTLSASSASNPWKPERHTGVHREKRYGVDHDLWSRSIRAPLRPMPDFVSRLLLPQFRRIRVLQQAPRAFAPNEGNAIEYLKSWGSWLKSHVDDRAKHREPVANLSTAGDCYMSFVPVSTLSGSSSSSGSLSGASGAGEVKVLLRRRTLVVLTGDARYRYTHGISKDDLLSDRRVSFTMREAV
jgi:alkylated DNA repair protein alkB family protein 4